MLNVQELQRHQHIWGEPKENMTVYVETRLLRAITERCAKLPVSKGEYLKALALEYDPQLKALYNKSEASTGS